MYPDNYPCVDGTGHFAEQISLRDSSILKGCVSIATFSAPSRVRASNDGDHRHLPASPVKSSVLCPCARTVSPVRGNHGPRAFLLQSQNDAEVLTQKSGVIMYPDNYPCVDGTGHFAEQISLRDSDSSYLEGVCLDRHVLRSLHG